MASFKEIVTKAVIGKGKKTFTTTNSVTPDCVANTILGCWVINHLLVIGDNHYGSR
ncbi:MAG: outer spore coat protein CotE [Bacilli bacterium]|nr:outer spore coat protein CotE [Bacilli bacterium]